MITSDFIPIRADEYHGYLRDLVRLHRQMRANRWERWQMFVYGLTIGALLSPIIAGWFLG